MTQKRTTTPNAATWGAINDTTDPRRRVPVSRGVVGRPAHCTCIRGTCQECRDQADDMDDDDNDTPARAGADGVMTMDEPQYSRFWSASHRADKAALPLADRHYNRQKIGSPQFVPPGRCTVLLTPDADALWVTSWPFAEYVKHAWPGAWVCSCFRNESPHLSSAMITDAVAVTRYMWPDIPALGMVTFVSRKHVRKKRDWGRCYRKAGWKLCGETKGGLVALQLMPDDMPEPLMPISEQMDLFMPASND